MRVEQMHRSKRPTRREFLQAAVLGGCAGGLGLVRPSRVWADSAAHRPIADFVDAQGTHVVFVPPVADFIGWSAPANGRFASVDYSGQAEKRLLTQGMSIGTTTQGSVSERPLEDGRANVLVNLYTRNALSWVILGPDYAGGPLLFGYRAPDVAAGAEPALGESHFQVEFINTAPGAPLPDLLVALGMYGDPPVEGFELIAVSFRANASGTLHELAGLGSDGTPARMVITQTGVLFRANWMGATADGFPAERIDLHATGQ